MVGSRSSRSGTLRVHAISPGVIGTVYNGYLSTRLVDDMLPEFLDTLGRSPTYYWLADAMGVTGFDVRMTYTAKPWLVAFKKQGGHTLIVASQSGLTRLTAASVSFAVGISIKTAETLDEALTLLPLH